MRVRGASVVRDGRTILHVDDFVVRRGEHLAILGPNGAGKSTLIGLLTREVHPLWADPYPVLFRGQPRIELAEARRLLGVVSSAWQETVRVHLPVAEVVLGGRFGALGVPPHLRRSVNGRRRAGCRERHGRDGHRRARRTRHHDAVDGRGTPCAHRSRARARSGRARARRTFGGARPHGRMASAASDARARRGRPHAWCWSHTTSRTWCARSTGSC